MFFIFTQVKYVPQVAPTVEKRLSDVETSGSDCLFFGYLAKPLETPKNVTARKGGV